MKKLFALTLAASVPFAFAGSAFAATGFCAAPGGGGFAVSCAAAACSCPAGYILIDTTETPSHGTGATPPTVPSQT